MSRKGNCYDNAAMESFWATLKTECFGSLIPESREKAKIMIFDDIECGPIRWRLHSALGYQSPLDYESPQSHKPDEQKTPSTLFRGKIRPRGDGSAGSQHTLRTEFSGWLPLPPLGALLPP